MKTQLLVHCLKWVWMSWLENITIITVIVPLLPDPGAERLLLVVDVAQGTELTPSVGLFLPHSSHSSDSQSLVCGMIDQNQSHVVKQRIIS